MPLIKTVKPTLTLEAFFEWMRSQQDDGRLSQDEVNGANELLALMEPDELKAILIKVNGWSDGYAMTLSDSGMNMLNEFEGFRNNPYLDTAKVATIGYGSTYYPDGRAVSMTDKPVSRIEASSIKQAVINKDFSPAVNMMFADEIERGDITQNRFDALISLVYNIGIKGLKGSSVYRHIKAGNYTAAADSFLLWNKVRKNGHLEVEPGLVTRRQKERKLFLA